MTDLLLWGGPVQTSDISRVAWRRPTEIVTFSRGPDGGIGSSSFSLLAQAFTDKDGRILPGLLASRGKRLADYDRVAIAGFSAFHGLASPLLAADGDSIDACILLDACFSALSNAPKAGYLAFGQLAAREERLMLFSSSLGGGQTYTTGSACASRNFDAAAAAAGVAPAPYQPPAPLPPIEDGRGARAGDLLILDYAGQFSHGDHVHKLGVPILDTYLAPYLARDIAQPVPPVESDLPPDNRLAWLTVAGLVIALGTYAWATRRH